MPRTKFFTQSAKIPKNPVKSRPKLMLSSLSEKDLIEELTKATDKLLYLSETDSPVIFSMLDLKKVKGEFDDREVKNWFIEQDKTVPNLIERYDFADYFSNGVEKFFKKRLQFVRELSGNEIYLAEPSEIESIKKYRKLIELIFDNLVNKALFKCAFIQPSVEIYSAYHAADKGEIAIWDNESGESGFDVDLGNLPLAIDVNSCKVHTSRGDVKVRVVKGTGYEKGVELSSTTIKVGKKGLAVGNPKVKDTAVVDIPKGKSELRIYVDSTDSKKVNEVTFALESLSQPVEPTSFDLLVVGQHLNWSIFADNTAKANYGNWIVIQTSVVET